MKHTQQLLVRIDEFTFTIIPKEKFEINDWEKVAENIIDEFVDNTMICHVLNGEIEEMNYGKLQGYSKAYNIGPKDYYLAMAYNSSHPSMGVCVRFSAKAWAIYQAQYRKLYDEQITLSDFLHMANDNIFENVRLSRVDFTADYINYNINLTSLYQDLDSNSILIQNDDGKNRIKNISFIGQNKDIETIYIGSRGENSRGYLRIYDKKSEQIKTNGSYKEKAQSCKEWIRFEAVYKGKYAHQIATTLLENNMSALELQKYIAQMITQKYRFFNCELDDYTVYTNDLLKVSEGNAFPSLKLGSPRDNALSTNIEHIRHGSGLFPTMYKIANLYGKEAAREFLEYLYDVYNSGQWKSEQMSRELTIWLKKHSDLKSIKLSDNY